MNKPVFSWITGLLMLLLHESGMAQALTFHQPAPWLYVFQNQVMVPSGGNTFPSNPHLAVNRNNSANVIAQYAVQSFFANSDQLAVSTSSQAGVTWSASAPTNLINGIFPGAAINQVGTSYISYSTAVTSSGVIYHNYPNNGSNIIDFGPGSVPGGMSEVTIAENDGNYSAGMGIYDTLYTAWISSDGTSNYVQSHIQTTIHTFNDAIGNLAAATPYLSSSLYRLEGLNFQTGLNGERYYCYAVAPTLQGSVNFPTGQAANTIIFQKTAPFLSTVQLSIQGIATNGKGADPNFNNVHVNDFPSMAVDKSGRTFNGRIYIAYATKVSNQTFIRLRYSTDNGLTWNNPNQSVNINIPSGRQNWHPAVTVDQATGALYIAYLSMDQPSGFSTNAYVAISNDGGNTFTNVLASDAPYLTTPYGIQKDATYAGDNISIIAADATATVCWPANGILYSAYIINENSAQITGPLSILDQQGQSGYATFNFTFPKSGPAYSLMHQDLALSAASGLTVISNDGNGLKVTANPLTVSPPFVRMSTISLTGPVGFHRTQTVTALTASDANFSGSAAAVSCNSSFPQTFTATNPLSTITGLTYTWSTDGGLTIVSGQGTRTVSVVGVPGRLTGNLTLTVAGYVSSVSSTQTINRQITTDQSAIFTGPATLNNSSSGTYTVPAVTGASYVWATSPGLSITSGQGTPSVSVTAESGASSEYINLNISACGTAYTYSIPVVSPVDNTLNWIFSRSYDESGKAVDEIKKFYDYSGNILQQQSRIQTITKILADAVVYDNLARGTVNTSPAPINNSSFTYNPGFVNTASGTTYNYSNFDQAKLVNPDPVGIGTSGTLGWYYSGNNNLEPYVAQTGYPFTQTCYFNDGTGEIKKSAAMGDPLKMGSGHETSSFTLPVINELAHYLSIRNQFFPSSLVGANPTNLINNAVQSITVDANGRQAVQIADRSGNVVMTARADPASILTVNNTGTISAGVDQQSSIAYFYLLSPQAISITGSYTLIDMRTETAITNTGTLPAGYYKLMSLSGTVTYSYTNALTDITYIFYNQLGRLIASISPNGVTKLLQTGLGVYTTKEQLPFITLYEYDLRGNLTARTDPDAGRTEYIYRKDGKIRFSQNALQRPAGRFSYTNYDFLNRPIESGEYVPGSVTFASLQGNSAVLEDVSTTGGITDGARLTWTRTHYDVADNSHGLTSYIQTFINGNVSWTEGSSGSKTWFSYDDLGNCTWMLKNIPGLGVKTMDYTYDMRGNVLSTDYQKGTPAERFVHNYTYDQDKRLATVSTTTDPAVTSIRQAKYYYYVHGPLKRVEIGPNLQGTDYTYTVQGALKAINNSNKGADPGQDGTNNGFGSDAFGEVLDYFPGDYINTRTGVQPIIGVNTSGIVPLESYAGNIKAMSWYSEKPSSIPMTNPPLDAPNAYVYQYDPKYQFTESTWGTGLTFAGTAAGITTSGINKEKAGNPASNIPPYDGNGNIQYLQRTYGNGHPTDQFTYTYTPNTNQLSSITNTSQTYATYTYDARGEVIAEVTGDGVTPSKYMVYDVTGKVTAIYSDAAHNIQTAGFVYDENGMRIEKLSYNTSGQLIRVTYYVDNVLYEQEVKNGGTSYDPALPQEYSIIGAGAGKVGIYYRQNGGIYAYELDDHLGNVRAVIAQSASTYDVRMYTDYFPYGMVINGPNGTNDYRYGYQGQNAELDGETSWNAFVQRMYDSKIARWLQYDPAGQFYSPYVGMGNDPVRGIDKDGAFATWLEAFWFKIFNGGDIVNNGKEYLVNEPIDGGVYAFNHWEDGGVWDSKFVRGYTGDVATLNFGVTGAFGFGANANVQVSIILHGPDKSIFPFVSYSVGQTYGYDVGASVTTGKSWYQGNLKDLGIKTLGGQSASINGSFGGITAGADASFNESVLTENNAFPDLAKVVDRSNYTLVGYHAGVGIGTSTAASLSGSMHVTPMVVHLNPFNFQVFKTE